jgi:autotransporter-associated beta strand protein
LLDNTLGTTRFAATSGAVTLSGVNTYIGAIGGNGTLSGANQIGLIAGTGGWTKVGSGELSITGNAGVANTYTGTTTIAEGLLTANRNAGVLAITGDLVINSSGTYGGNNNNDLIASASNLTVNGVFFGNNRSTANAITQTVNSLSGSGTIKAAWQNFAGANTTLTVSSTTTNSTFSGRILDDNAVFNLVKSGTGTTLTLAGNNTYDGTTAVNAGTLLVSGTHTGGGAYSVASLGKLGGDGNITAASLTVSAGGKLSPGGDGVLGHNFTFSLAGGMDLSASSNNTGAYLFDLGSSGSSDMITLATGTLNVGTLDFADFSFNTVSGFGGGSYVLFDASSSITGTIGTASGTIGGLAATLSIDSVNNNVLLTVVPEPNSVVLMASGVCLLGFARRVRRCSGSVRS